MGSVSAHGKKRGTEALLLQEKKLIITCLLFSVLADESSMATDHIVELVGIHYTGPVQTPSCVQSLTGTGLTAPLIKDVSLEVHAGEVMAVLGKKFAPENQI